MALFTHEDFIILGMLFAKYFTAYIFDFGNGAWGGGSWTGGGGGYIPEREPTYGTGRGGIIERGNPSDGDDGRPGASDNSTGPSDTSLAGGRGMLTSPGQGLNNGGFGFGGRAQTSVSGWTSSAGGGSGWFGGGCAFFDGGGGGGSNWCLSLSQASVDGLRAAADSIQPAPYWLTPGKWVGVDVETMSHYLNNLPLYDVNTKHIQEYDKHIPKLGNAYEAFINLRKQANGNGLILISEPNKMISINTQSGVIENIGQIVEFTGHAVKWKPSPEYELASYHFILWGAQGGTIMYTPAGMGGLTYQQYTGGFGGALGCVFDIPRVHQEIDDEGNVIDVETELFLYVGEQGRQQRFYNTFNGGGNGDGGCTSGGGATDIRFGGDESDVWMATLHQRVAVAGGGGGCIAANYGGAPQGPFKDSTSDGVSKNKEIKIPSDESDGPIYFLVNDRSLVYVTLKYFTQSQLPDNRNLSCTIYINGGQEGVLFQQFDINPVSGTVEIVYELDQVYPPNTETHWVRIDVTVGTNVMFVIPEGGVNIRVETRAGVNESNSNLSESKRSIYLRALERLVLKDLVNVRFESLPGDERDSEIESANLVDLYRVQLQAVQLLRLSVLESLSLTDKHGELTEKEEPPQPVGDILLSAIENINLLDLVKTTVDEIKRQENTNVESATLSDLARVTMQAIKVMRLSVLESLNLNDINKEESIDETE